MQFEVNLQRRVFLTALEPELAKQVVAFARRQGVSSETLINLWLTEKLAAATARGSSVMPQGTGSGRDALAERARHERKSMQEYLLGELERLAERPSSAQWLDRVRSRKARKATRVLPSKILQHRDAERR